MFLFILSFISNFGWFLQSLKRYAATTAAVSVDNADKNETLVDQAS